MSEASSDQNGISADPTAANNGGYGVAIDVGTSSIWSRLVRLEDDQVLDTLVVANPQQQHGADITSRLGSAASDAGIRAALHAEVIDTMNTSIGRLCADAGIAVGEVKEIVAVGNSAMYAFMLDVDPAPLCGTPFNLKGAEDYFGPAKAFGVNPPEARLFIPKPIFGFVGADALADILLVDMAGSSEIELIVDVGTNCEMALGNRDKILVASSPAGPAYEDSHMSFGLSATEGAIYQARLDGERFEYSVVGDGEPKGICGSGLIDIIAEMRASGWVDEGGRLLREGPIVIAAGDNPVTVSQHDIRSFQLVKASVHAAISVLQKKFGSDELGRMLITGTFGSYINLDNARVLKMFPDLPNERIEVVVDAACQGAVLMLGEAHRRSLDGVHAKIRHVALPLNKNFQDEFIRLMAI
ncbi:MAG: ASKHA domain-containing protein [Thermoleophilia bacterium]|nr:ASKHA domain-containing protein [Thermoleophilia bacterium]